jgi:iron complex outermembrane recepter protein
VKAFTHTSGERLFVRNAGATAVSLAVLAMASSVAYAQQAADTAKKAEEPIKLETLEVTGIRRGIESAISVKKNSDNIVESISAEDIGKLPDNSIAESIARLPGVAAQRVAGRAQVISVRGLSPDFATSLLNGRELVSTGDNRSVEFDQYPSELLSGVTIYKTPDAGLVGQGLSGTLDMQTVRPLNFANRVIAFNVRGSNNSLGGAADSSANGYRASASYIGQSADRTFGFAFGYARQQSPVQENQVGTYEPWKTDGRVGLPAGTYSTDGFKALRRTGESTRDGLMATLEFRPSKSWTSVLDLFHSQAKQTDTANQWEVNTQYNGDFPCKPDCAWTPTINGNNTLTGGTLANVYPLVRGMYNTRDDKIDAIGWNNKFKLGTVSLNADISYSKAKRDEINLENNTQLLPSKQLDTLAVSFRNGGFSQFTPQRDYSNPTNLFLTGTIYGSGYGKTPSVKDELTSLKLSGSIPAPAMIGNLVSDVEVGLNYSDREKVKRQPEGNINLGSQGDTAIGSQFQYGLVDLGFAGVGKIPSWNVPAAVAQYMRFNPVDNLDYLIPKAWTVNEKVTTAFIKANLDSQWGSASVRGNIGLQIQNTDQSSSSRYFDKSQPAGSEVRPYSDGKKYTDFLPALNLVFQLPNDHTVRFAAARQIARPRVDQLRAGLDFGISNDGVPGGGGGNPKLDPWRANALDLSWEKYFGTKAYVAAAAYYKDLRSYIYTQSRTYDFSALTAGVTRPPLPRTNFGEFSAPFNGNGGKLQGLELAASLPFNMITPTLDGFGVQLSASFNNSNIKIKDPESANSVGSGDIGLPGLSKSNYNLTAYYEKSGFEARVSHRQRSDFIGEIGNFNGARTLRYVVGESVLDAQLGYAFNAGSLKGLSVLFQVNSLNDPAYRTYAGTKDRPLEYAKYGRTYLLGASYKF